MKNKTKKKTSKTTEEKKQQKKADIIKAYLSFVKENNCHPSVSDMTQFGFSGKSINHYFGNITTLKEVIKKENKDFVDKHIFDETSFTVEKFKKIQNTAKKKKRFFITTAVSNHPLHKKAFDSIKSYCKKKKAELLIIPIQDPSTGSGLNNDYNLPLELRNENIVFGDVELNSNIKIRSIKIQAKQIKPLTGLARLGKRSGSFIFGSPKQFLESIPTTKKYPHLMMTTGAITQANYKSSDKYFTQRTAYLANYDHTLGGIIVETRNDVFYNFRHVQIEPETGNFFDLGTYYKSDGTTEKLGAELLSMGDLHPEQVDWTVLKSWKVLCKKADVKGLVIHDGFDGKSIGHHDYKKSITNARKFYTNTLSLEEELDTSIKVYKFCESMVGGDIYFAKSNHDEVLDRYLEEGRYVLDPINLKFASYLIAPMIEGENVLKTALKKKGYLPERLKFLDRDEALIVGGVECGQHGDKGNNGGRATADGLEKAYGNCVVGHSHSPKISRGVFINGTTSKLKLDYNVGPSSWAHASTLIYKNGSRQLIFCIEGKTFLEGK